MTDVNRLVAKYVEAHDAHDFDALSELCSRDCELVGPVVTVRGRDAIRAALPVFLDAFSDDKFTVDRLLVVRSTLVLEWTYVATHTATYNGPTGAVQPSGRRVTLRGADVFDVADENIVRYRSYFDHLDLLTQLGAIEGST